MSNHREAQLENMRWSDKLFTGDSVKNVGIKAHDAMKRDLDLVEKNFTLGRKRTVDHQIGNRLFPKLTDPNKPFEGSLHNKIDLLRISDARRAFRQKYADRNSVEKIFDRYDSGN